MPPDQSYVTTHIHTDGPIPGPHSLLTLTSAAFTPEGSLISTFTVNVHELPGATLHPTALTHWRTRAEDWLCTRRSSRPPAIAMRAYLRWAEELPGTRTFVTDTALPDYLFVYWYSQRYAGGWPFAETSTDPDLRARIPRPQVCHLSHCKTPAPAMANTS